MKIEELTDKAIDYIISGLEDSPRLSDWEKNFLESVSDQWNRNRSLSDNQKMKLGEIWDKQP